MKQCLFISLVSKHTAQIVMLFISKCLIQINAEHTLFCIGYDFIFLKTNLILMIGFVGVLFYIMFVLR
jgi:hypothetical protein